MSYLVQFLIDAISVGGLYALVALGIGLIFGVVGLVNFAHGDYVMIGTYCILLMAGFHVPVAIAVTMLAVAVVAVSSDLFVFRPVRTASPATLMIVSFSLSYALEHTFVMSFGSLARTINFLPEMSRNIEIFGLRIAAVSLLQIGATIVLTALLAGIIKYTAIGYQMRAVSENVKMARLVGVNVNRVVLAAFLASAVLAATVSVLFLAQTGTTTPFFGQSLTIIGFVATVIGGMGSLVGCALGGFLVGFITTALQLALPPSLQPFREAFVFGAVMLMLVVRPGGLIMIRTARERV
ncbi:MAG: branched-chain amino acid ABC transporter permease [Parvibaculaceae bacterium]